MNDFCFGFVEFYFVGFEGEWLDLVMFCVLVDFVDSGVVCFFDVVIVIKFESGEV